MTERDGLTEQRIFEAATDIFEERGMEGARMQDIADRAGINKALLHYYFRTKDKLFAAVFERLAEKMFKKFSGILATDLPVEEKLQAFFTEHMDFLKMNPRLPLFILREVNRNPLLLEKFLNRINIDGIRSSIQSKEGKQPVPAEEVAHLMVSVISLSVFPILARPILEGVLETQGIDYNKFIEERKEYSPKFIMTAINNMAK